ncbi:MAG: hypothetical protein ACI4MP_10270 [Candidatus Ventricola sp.]
MQKEKRRWPLVLGVALCVLTLALSVALQEAGYLTYLNGDMASEMILARRQADTGSLVQMDWIYSTEIHTVHMNLFYALAFLFTDSFMAARIIGNTIGFVIAMLSCVVLCRTLGLSTAKGLCTAALLPFAAGTLYASNMTIGGYYIIHLPFAFFGAALWLSASEGGRGRTRGLTALALFLLVCLLEGLLSVRYVLCFICPMAVVAGLDVLLAPQLSRSLRDHHLRFGGVTAAGFLACAAGYAAAELLYPRLFESGVGSAGSFVFNPLDGGAMASSLATVFADFLKLLGWLGGAPLFSLSGIANLCIAAVLVLAGLMTVRVWRGLDTQERTARRQKRLLQYAFAALLVNLFCFVFIQGTYLNRYLILAVLFFIPALTVVVARERSLRLRWAFLFFFLMMLGTAGGHFLLETRAQQPAVQQREADMMDTADFLIGEGYTHGYGDFWVVRVMQERTGGALTFTGVRQIETEEGAVCPVSLEMIRWLEPQDASHMDACPGKTFLTLTRDQSETLAPWLEMTGAPVIHENGKYVTYGFDSSAALINCMLLGQMKLENAACEDSVFTMQAGGRMRVPTGFREAGTYVLTFTCAGEPGEGSRAAAYATKRFEVIGEGAIAAGENELTFTLNADDQYFMLLLTSGEAQELAITDLQLRRCE